ncbi:MAG: hypothetical protein K0S36_1444 [Nitrosospira multiformis]|jgi:motility quorum-sensing regulator/GCU-specific mRNA interferase toxin|nr:hypothetical protein [Nitrosospira multiformis]
MEKGKPHYELEKVKTLIRAGQYQVTEVAIQGGWELGIKGKKAIVDFVLTLRPVNFYKRLTSNFNHKEGQDVYHAPGPDGKTVYLKFTVAKDVLITSFKEK